MTPLSKYLLGLAAVASGLFSGYETAIYGVPMMTTPEASTAQWKVARLIADPATPVIPAGSLSPIYPATPGKELLGKPLVVAVRVERKHQSPLIAKANDKPIRQALAINKLPQNFFIVSRQDKYPEQRLGYASEPQSQPLALVGFGHGIY